MTTSVLGYPMAASTRLAQVGVRHPGHGGYNRPYRSSIYPMPRSAQPDHWSVGGQYIRELHYPLEALRF